MLYHPDDFVALSQEIERQSGYLDPDPCHGSEFRLKMPGGPGGKAIWKRYRTAHCGLHARVGVAYDPTQPVQMRLPTFHQNGEETGEYITIDHPGEPYRDEPSFATACAVDDSVGAWPRFQDVISDESYVA